MNVNRLIALAAAVGGVLFLGYALQQAVQVGRFALAPVVLGVVLVSAAAIIRRRAPR